MGEHSDGPASLQGFSKGGTLGNKAVIVSQLTTVMKFLLFNRLNQEIRNLVLIHRLSKSTAKIEKKKTGIFCSPHRF